MAEDNKFNLEKMKEIGKEKLSIITDIVDEIYDIFTYKYEVGELLINIFFIALVIIVSLILYWDNVNNAVSSKSRCKRQLNIIDNSSGEYLIQGKDKNNNKLFNIKYNLAAKSTSVECDCKDGNTVNHFNDIPIRDLRNNQDTKVTKTCSCDVYYNTGEGGSDVLYDGEPGIIRYMNVNDSTFFDNGLYALK